MPVREEQVRRLLGQIRYPGFSRDIVSAGVLRGVQIDDGRVRLKLDWVGEDAAVTLTSGGIPIAPGEATVLDFSVDGKQTNFRLPIGKDGRMPTALLTPGHLYRMDFRASPHPIRYFEWQPVDRLEIDDLPSTPPSIK